MNGPLSLKVGEYGKEENNDKLHCERCGAESEMLYGILDKQKGPMKVCMKCLKQHTSEGGKTPLPKAPEGGQE